MSDELKHYGMPRRSGRYPWGSGENPYQRCKNFRAHIQELRNQGLSDVEIAKGEGISTTQLRARLSIAKAEVRAAESAQALRLKEKGYSNMAIGRRMNLNESTVRSLLNPALQEKAAITRATVNMLKENADEKKFIDVGVGVEKDLGISRAKLNTAVAELVDDGYKLHKINVNQVGIPGQFTTVKVLGAPETEWKDIVRPENFDKIKTITAHSDDHGRTYRSVLGMKPVQSIKSDRVQIRYKENGGEDKDGVIELRRGVKDLDLGASKYAQVRIAVDDTHYMKGMAIYSDKMPDGVDAIYNTNKSIKSHSKLEVMKKLSTDPDNPFGATIKEGGQRGAINVVNEEGDWGAWSKTISSQVLSKQPTPLAKKQLNLALKLKQEQRADISALTNPIVKKHLLLALADDCDSSASHLKAAALPRQTSKVILPILDVKPTEVYAPTYRPGETVVLIRHPHGGIFEIAELTVNTKTPAAKSIMRNAPDAIGINPQVARKLSGADFDGDAVIVIPNNKGEIKSSASLKGLKNFDPITFYPPFDGMRTIDGGTYNAKTKQVAYPDGKPQPQTMQTRMGEVSNLITDMTIKGANFDELARVVRHSMVVIDSEKHHLNYKLSHEDNGIAALSRKYQTSSRGGAATLISRAASKTRVPHRQSSPRIDPKTGEKIHVLTGQTYVNAKGQLVERKSVSNKMAEVSDAHTLSSGRPIEIVYADYANSLKGLAKEARKEALSTTPIPYSPSARVAYEKEVATLNAQLNIALKNKPRERQAQTQANSIVERKKQANPGLSKDDIKKLNNQALAEARARTGAKKTLINITDKEWEAIQAGAVSPSKLTEILQNSDLSRIKQLATPYQTDQISPVNAGRAKSMLSAGYTQAEVAEVLGISVTTLMKTLD